MKLDLVSISSLSQGKKKRFKFQNQKLNMAIILSAFIPNIINLLSNLMENEEIMNRVCNIDEIMKLKNKVEKIGDFVRDAEIKKLEDSKIEKWIENLREIIYEIDDFVDRCYSESEVSKRQDNKEFENLEEYVYHRVGIHHELTQSIKSLNKKTEDILKDVFQLKLSQSVSKNLSSISTLGSSPFPGVDVVGNCIKNDTKTLVSMLLNEENNNKNNNHVFSIVLTGQGGIGKTTLAREVFEDEMVKHVFETKIWINVSHDFTYAKILYDIINLGGGNLVEMQNESQLEGVLGKLMSKKRFLLVLDNLGDSEILENLLNFSLQNGTRGSKVLITTGDENVVSKYGAHYIYSVKQLSVKDGWSLLCESSSLSNKEMQDLNEIGAKIVKRCKLIPLAIKVIGGVLRSKKKNKEEWKGVYENVAWSFKGLNDDTMRALYLAYEDLPSHLKQCFLYFSLFPCDFVIKKRFITYQWISQGLVEMKENLSFEEVSQGYLNELISRNLIQVDSLNGIETFKMHDLLKSLANFLLQGEKANFLLQGENKYQISFIKKGLNFIPREITKFNHLRVLLLNENPIKHQTLSEIFTKLLHLRVLDLSKTLIEQIPDSLGNLLHLRYLNLSHSRLKELPNTIGDLINLHFLLLNGCSSLNSLPFSIERLLNLRSLDLQGTNIQHVSFDISKLNQLNSLHGFIVNNNDSFENDQNGWPLEELNSLSELTNLHISNVERTLDGAESRKADLSSKTHLKELELRSCISNRSIQALTEVLRIEEIFEELCPSNSLESLKIVDYFGQVYPSWLSILSNLQKLELVGCMFCQSVPLMGELSNLRFLSIKGSFAIDSIGPFTFPKLESFHIKHMHNLETWYPFPPGSAPCLKTLQIESCPKLKSLPKGLEYANALMELIILDLDSLQVIDNVLSVKSLIVRNCTNLGRILNLSSLEKIFLTNCRSLNILENIKSVKYLHMINDTLNAIPQWIGLHSSRLERLNLIGPIELLERCHMDGPDWSLIRDISQVYACSSDRSVHFSYTKRPFKFVTNLRGLNEREISSFSSWGGNAIAALAIVVGLSAFAVSIYRYKRGGKRYWFSRL